MARCTGATRRAACCAARRRGSAAPGGCAGRRCAARCRARTAISLDDRCWSTSRRQSSWPAVSRATRCAIISIRGRAGRLRNLSGTHVRILQCNPHPAQHDATPRAPSPPHPYAISRRFRHISGGLEPFRMDWARSDGRPVLRTPDQVRAKQDGGEGWIRTSVRLRGQIYSLLPLTTRPPLQVGQARQMAARLDAVNACEQGSACCRRRSRYCSRALQTLRHAPGMAGVWSG